MNMRLLYRTGWLAFAAYLLLAVMYFRERMAFADTAYYLFEMVRTGKALPSFRFVGRLTEAFPLAAIHTGAPLQIVAIAYSVSFILLYAFVYACCGWLRQYKTGVAWLLIQIILVGHNFFWPVSELPQGLAVMLLSIALLQYFLQTGKLLAFIASLLLVPVVSFAHPMLAAPFFFIAAFSLGSIKNNASRKAWAALLLLYITSICVRYFLLPADDEVRQMHLVQHFDTKLRDYFYSPALQQFYYGSVTRYFMLTSCFIMVVGCYIYRKDWRKLALVTLSYLGYVLIIHRLFSEAGTNEFYREHTYYAMAVIVAYPLATDILPSLNMRRQTLPAAVFILITITGLLRIVWAHPLYAARVAWLRSHYLHDPDIKTAGIADNLDTGKVLFSWGTAYEVWALSMIDNGRVASVVYYEHPEDIPKAANQSSVFLTFFSVYPYRELPAQYFRFGDAERKYNSR